MRCRSKFIIIRKTNTFKNLCLHARQQLFETAPRRQQTTQKLPSIVRWQRLHGTSSTPRIFEGSIMHQRAKTKRVTRRYGRSHSEHHGSQDSQRAKKERLTPRYGRSHLEGPWIEKGYDLQAKGAESVIFISTTDVTW